MKEVIKTAIVLRDTVDREGQMELTLQVSLNNIPVAHSSTEYPNMCTIEKPREGDRLSLSLSSVFVNGNDNVYKYGFVPYIYGVSLNHVVYGDRTTKESPTMLIAKGGTRIANWIEGTHSGNPEIVFTNELEKQVNTVLKANPNVAEIMIFVYREKKQQYNTQYFNNVTEKSITRGGVGMGKDTNQIYQKVDFEPDGDPYLFTVRFTERKVQYADPFTTVKNPNSFNTIPRV